MGTAIRSVVLITKVACRTNVILPTTVSGAPASWACIVSSPDSETSLPRLNASRMHERCKDPHRRLRTIRDASDVTPRGAVDVWVTPGSVLTLHT